MNNKKVDLLDMIEATKVKDSDSYSLGTYYNKVPVNGFYLKSKKGSLLERIEQMAKSKFQLENDPENYMQEARVELWLSVIKYYDRFGYDEDVKADGLIYTDVKYKMMDKAKLAKGNVSVCDRSTGKYHINKIESYEQKFIEENDKIKNQKDERFLSDIYNGSIFNDTESSNEFIIWLNKNKSYILTKKQIDYLEGNVIINDVSGEWRIKKNIIKRIEESYANDKIRINKLNQLNKEIKVVDNILDFKNEKDLLTKILKLGKKKNSFIIIELYENLNKTNCMTLTKMINSEADLNSLEIDKGFFYEIIDILIKKENHLKGLVKNIENGSDRYKWD